MNLGKLDGQSLASMALEEVHYYEVINYKAQKTPATGIKPC